MKALGESWEKRMAGETKAVEIDPEFDALVPKLGDEELKGLEASLKLHGCEDSLKVWRDPADGKLKILDGHNRYRICEAADPKIPYTIKIEKGIKDRNEAFKYVIDASLDRRSLTHEQARFLRGRRLNLERRQGARTDLTSPQIDAKSGGGAKGGGVRKKLAERYGVSEATMTRDGAFAGQIEKLGKNAPTLAANILTHKVQATDEEIAQLSNLQISELKVAEDKAKAGTTIKVKDLLQPKDNKKDAEKKPTINDDADILAVRSVKRIYLEHKRPRLGFNIDCVLSLDEGTVSWDGTHFEYETACEEHDSIVESTDQGVNDLVATCAECMNLSAGCRLIATPENVAEMEPRLKECGLLDSEKAWKKVLYGGGYALVGWVKRDDGKPEFMVVVDNLNVATVPGNDIANLGKVTGADRIMPI